MNQSEEINELAAALVAAQGAFGVAELNAKNPFFKSRYADLESVWSACRPALEANGLAVLQLPGHYQELSTDPARILGILNLETIIVHSSGQWISSIFQMPLAKIDPQGAGSAISYARRYALAAALGIVTSDDDDGNSATGNRIEPPAVNTNQLRALHAAGQAVYGTDWDAKRPQLVGAVTGGRTTSSKQLTAAELGRLIDGINAKANGG